MIQAMQTSSKLFCFGTIWSVSASRKNTVSAHFTLLSKRIGNSTLRPIAQSVAHFVPVFGKGGVNFQIIQASSSVWVVNTLVAEKKLMHVWTEIYSYPAAPVHTHLQASAYACCKRCAVQDASDWRLWMGIIPVCFVFNHFTVKIMIYCMTAYSSAGRVIHSCFSQEASSFRYPAQSPRYLVWSCNWKLGKGGASWFLNTNLATWLYDTFNFVYILLILIERFCLK